MASMKQSTSHQSNLLPTAIAHDQNVLDNYQIKKAYQVKEVVSLKGSQLGAFCPKTTVYCYLEFKLRFLKNLKLFLIRVKTDLSL